MVAVPGCGFFHRSTSEELFSPAAVDYQSRYVRFAFCKSDETLALAAQKIAKVVDDAGLLKLFNQFKVES